MLNLPNCLPSGFFSFFFLSHHKTWRFMHSDFVRSPFSDFFSCNLDLKLQLPELLNLLALKMKLKILVCFVDHEKEVFLVAVFWRTKNEGNNHLMRKYSWKKTGLFSVSFVLWPAKRLFTMFRALLFFGIEWKNETL